MKHILNINKKKKLDNLRNKEKKCSKCQLFAARINYVFGEGNPDASVMFIGEAPGYEEDRQGKPFVGRSGKLLNKLFDMIGLKREDVYICNMVKCHPMKNPNLQDKRNNDRPPTKKEIAACNSILLKQIKIVNPKIICTLGNTPTQAFLKTKTGISKLRGHIVISDGIKFMPLYHPAAILRNPLRMKDMVSDFNKILTILNDSI